MIEYQLTRRIGSGGMGDVYQAIEITPAGGRIPVACQLLKGVLREEKPLISMFTHLDITFLSPHSRIIP